MITKIKLYSGGYTKSCENGENISTNGSYLEDEEVKEFLLVEGNSIEPEFTDAELLQQIEDAKPKVVTMRQARLALLQSGLLATVETAITSGTDETIKIEWEYATEVKRDWASLIVLMTALGKTSADIDALFQLASTK